MSTYIEYFKEVFEQFRPIQAPWAKPFFPLYVSSLSLSDACRPAP